MAVLTGKQVRFLRGLGHHLEPVVRIGKEEISQGVVEAVNEALEAHELIKVKLQDGCDLDRKEAADILARQCRAQVTQILGRTILLFRQGEKPRIDLP